MLAIMTAKGRRSLFTHTTQTNWTKLWRMVKFSFLETHPAVTAYFISLPNAAIVMSAFFLHIATTTSGAGTSTTHRG
jgi:hypothetical protein